MLFSSPPRIQPTLDEILWIADICSKIYCIRLGGTDGFGDDSYTPLHLRWSSELVDSDYNIVLHQLSISFCHYIHRGYKWSSKMLLVNPSYPQNYRAKQSLQYYLYICTYTWKMFMFYSSGFFLYSSKSLQREEKRTKSYMGSPCRTYKRRIPPRDGWSYVQFKRHSALKKEERRGGEGPLLLWVFTYLCLPGCHFLLCFQFNSFYFV